MAKKRLKTIEDCRRFLADVANRLNNAEIDPNTASRLAYIINVLKSCIESGDLERRLEELERVMSNRT